MSGLIRFVQLEAAAFLTDPDFMRMSCEQRGVYCSLIFLMYCNEGELKVEATPDGTANSNDIASLCNDFELTYNLDTVLSKFIFSNGLLSHKRVTEELDKAKNFSKVKRKAGLMGAKKRWHSGSTANGTAIPPAIAKKSKVKVSKVKVSKVKQKRKCMEFVYLTEDEYNKLLAKFGKQNLREKITDLNLYIGKIGEAKAKKKYSSHYHTILSWARKNEPKGYDSPKREFNHETDAQAKKLTADIKARKAEAEK